MTVRRETKVEVTITQEQLADLPRAHVQTLGETLPDDFKMGHRVTRPNGRGQPESHELMLWWGEGE